MSYMYKIATRRSRHNTSSDYALIVMSRTDKTITNESRLSADRIPYANYRANEALVVKIISLDNLTTMDSFVHSTFIDNKSPIKFTVGSVVRPDWFDTDLYMVCTSGLHYYNTIERAFSFIPLLMYLSASEPPSIFTKLTDALPDYDNDGHFSGYIRRHEDKKGNSIDFDTIKSMI